MDEENHILDFSSVPELDKRERSCIASCVAVARMGRPVPGTMMMDEVDSDDIWVGGPTLRYKMHRWRRLFDKCTDSSIRLCIGMKVTCMGALIDGVRWAPDPVATQEALLCKERAQTWAMLPCDYMRVDVEESAETADGVGSCRSVGSGAVHAEDDARSNESSGELSADDGEWQSAAAAGEGSVAMGPCRRAGAVEGQQGSALFRVASGDIGGVDSKQPVSMGGQEACARNRVASGHIGGADSQQPASCGRHEGSALKRDASGDVGGFDSKQPVADGGQEGSAHIPAVSGDGGVREKAARKKAEVFAVLSSSDDEV